MEKLKNIFTSADDSQIIAKLPNDKCLSNLHKFIPPWLIEKFQINTSPEATIHLCINNLHLHQNSQDLKQFFQQIGANIGTWISKATPSEKAEYIFESLDKNVEQNLKRVNHEINHFLNNANIHADANKKIKKNQSSNDFDWLVLNTKNEMLKSKLKTKLVQTINQSKNESRLRETIGRLLQEHEKIHLEDDSLEVQERAKIDYEWTAVDQKIFVENVKKLKSKFATTQFLKACNRYKFISNSQLATLASEQISRKLDKSNKAFLSRQFLLDKYFSPKQTLTERQMKFILKTSPLMGRCVDKAFVRAALKNISYEDINRMQLQIAQEIINKFETIRNLVKKSRKNYKQQRNSETKKKINEFQVRKNEKIHQNFMQDNLQKHKTKMIRTLNYRPQTASNQKTQYDKIESKKENIVPNKTFGPIPLNNFHPSTAIFIKDCNEQGSDDCNEYERNYLQLIGNYDENQGNRSKISKESMIKFYTGGPLQNYDAFCKSSKKLNERVKSKSSKKINERVKQKQKSKSRNKENRSEMVKIICDTFKRSHYLKQICEKLDNYDSDSEISREKSQKKPLRTMKNTNEDSTTKRTKKATEYNDPTSMGSAYNPSPELSSTENAIKNKLLQGKQRAKMAVYVKKLLSLAAENSFLSLRALNAKFSIQQVNTVDAKGNTALFYATKHRNSDFIDYLIGQKADVNIKCSKGLTPLHNAFKSNDYSIICKCLTGHFPPNLNSLDDSGKTPLAYCTRKILQTLGLQNGVVFISSNNKNAKFDNNSLLHKDRLPKNNDDELQIEIGLKRNQNTRILECA